MPDWPYVRWQLYRRVLQPLIRPLEQKLLDRLAGNVPSEARDAGDVFIVSYPRSGSHWFRSLLAATVYRISPEELTPRLAGLLVPWAFDGTYYARFAAPMYFKTHALPRPQFRRVVYLLRDGRDAMVSYLRFRQVTEPGPIDFLAMVQEFRHPDTEALWHEHVCAWLANPFGADLLVIKYEDLLRDPVAELRRFTRFAGLARADEELARVAKECSFASLRQMEALQPFVAAFGPGKPDFFIRRGVIGSHRDEMPPQVLAAFMELAGETLRQCGYLDELLPAGVR